MGEAKQRSRSRKEILAAATRCVYCDNPAPTQIEHMPPRGLFKDKDRPAGWEFACCERCNQGSRGADAVAQMFSLLSPPGEIDWKDAAFRKRFESLRQNAPDVANELLRDIAASKPVWLQRTGLMREAEQLAATGSATCAHLDVFAAKVAMATFAELIGRPIEMGGILFTRWMLNSGMPEEVFETSLRIFPVFGQLQQGRKTSGAQFQLRYNSDDKSLVGALVSLHGNLSIALFATDGPDYVAWFDEHFQDLAGPTHRGAQLTHPGLPGLEALSGPSL